jgi:hypothetical protein
MASSRHQQCYAQKGKTFSRTLTASTIFICFGVNLIFLQIKASPRIRGKNHKPQGLLT